MSNLEIDLTKAQADFLNLDCSFPLFVAGKGSGKSFTMGLNVVLDALESPEGIVGVYEPTHKLSEEVAEPNVKYWLGRFGYEEGVHYDHNLNKHKIKSRNNKFGEIRFYTYSDPSLLIGYQTSTAHVDELDTLNLEAARKAWAQILSRNRLQPSNIPEKKKKWASKKNKYEFWNKCSAYTSPEGYRFCYDRWVKNANDSYKRVHGSVRDNPSVSQAYIDDQIENMTKEEVDAFIDGEFRNLTSGTVYSAYNRETHKSFETIQPEDTLHIGMDFNVMHMAATVFVRRNGNEWHAVDYLADIRDTPAIIELIKNKWQSKGHQIYVYPDASGDARKSVNASQSDISQLKDAGFIVKAPKKNGAVKDRVAAMQAALSNGLVYINDYTCGHVADCLEQQAYNKNGEPDKDSGHDHQNDATTYFIVYTLPVRKILYPLSFKWAV